MDERESSPLAAERHDDDDDDGVTAGDVLMQVLLTYQTSTSLAIFLYMLGQHEDKHAYAAQAITHALRHVEEGERNHAADHDQYAARAFAYSLLTLVPTLLPGIRMPGIRMPDHHDGETTDAISARHLGVDVVRDAVAQLPRADEEEEEEEKDERGLASLLRLAEGNDVAQSFDALPSPPHPREPERRRWPHAKVAVPAPLSPVSDDEQDDDVTWREPRMRAFSQQPTQRLDEQEGGSPSQRMRALSQQPTQRIQQEEDDEGLHIGQKRRRSSH